MIGASKILTVSYGTFSCTLEGFEEPFNTMKAIAEYFRDLAADDRYFGAEPATPDAAMLHKIAEREIQRRVESKIDGNGVILRAEEQAPPKVSIPAAQAAPPPAPVLAPAPPQTVAPTVAPMAAAVVAAEHAVESAAARLSRLRAAQSQILAPVAPPAPIRSDISSRFADVEAYVEDQEVAPPAPVAPPVAEVAPAPQPEPVAKAAPPEPIPEPQPEPVAEPETVAEPEPVATVEVEPVAEVTEVAESLATVTEAPDQDEDLAETADLTETVDQPEAEAAPASDDILNSLRETLAGLIGQDDQLAADMSAASDGEAALVATEDDLPEDIALTNAEPEEIEEADHTDMAFLSMLDQDTTEPTAEAEAEAEVEEEAAAPEAEPVADIEPVSADLPAPEPEAAPEESDAAKIDVAEDAPVVAEKLQRARARVIKIRRLDKKPDVPAQVVASPLGDLPPYPAVEPKAPTLSAEAEADLMNELASLDVETVPTAADPVTVEQDTSFDTTLEAALAAPDASEPETVAEVETTEAAEPLPPIAAYTPDKQADTKLPSVAAADASVDRLLAQTNSELEVPETKRRRSAIAHLKAAVLATVAERKNNPNASKQEATVRMDPYRNDLSAAVRPTTGGQQGDRPAPLVLVSAQRIDQKRDALADAHRPVPQIVMQSASSMQSAPAMQPTSVQPVRPRRVSSGSLAHAMQQDESMDEDNALSADALDNIFSDGSKQSFAEFAERLGAENMAELIEAAGAYHTLVLDQPSFTRPQLFKQMTTMPHLAEMSREDSLRGFGKLLRDGRIQKSVRGQFVMSDASPMLTEAKKIAS